ncbi:MAG: histidine phosphatase family protein, partial [Mycobacterium sp.]
MLPRLRIASITLLTAVGLFLVSAVPAWAAQSITLTWVRHAQSLANAAGYISSTVPGPVLTPLGEQQAAAVAQTLAATAHDGVYVSDMIRTSLTAAPYVALSGIDPVVLGGVREITAGYLEGQTNTGADSLAFEVAGLLYSIPVAAWSLGLRALPVIFGETGNNFNARTTDAINTVYASGDLSPVVFAHGATIQAWTLMNVSNPVITGPLENTGIVVVNGNPEDGWTLQSWNEEEVSPTPNLLTKLFLDFRELIVTPQRSIYNIVQSLPYDSWFADGTSLATVAAAVWDGVVAIVTAP